MRKPAVIVVMILVLSAAFCREGRAQRLAVKTNALSWAALAPDLGLEIVTGERTSLSLSVCGPDMPFSFPYQLVVIRPEYRFWFNGRPLTREYVGLSAFGARYAITLPAGTGMANVFKGDGLAAGVSGGYVFNLSKRWNFELSGGTGLLLFRQKQFFSTDSYEQYFVEEVSKPNTIGYKLFPVNLSASFIYIVR